MPAMMMITTTAIAASVRSELDPPGVVDEELEVTTLLVVVPVFTDCEAEELATAVVDAL